MACYIAQVSKLNTNIQSEFYFYMFKQLNMCTLSRHERR